MQPGLLINADAFLPTKRGRTQQLRHENNVSTKGHKSGTM